MNEIIDDLKQLEDKANQYIEDNLSDLTQQNIIPEIKSVARAMNLPQGFIDGISFKMVGKKHVKIINTWGTKKKPLAKWFNYGTKTRIWIEPKIKKALAWFAGGGRNANAIYYKNSGTKKGDALFSTGHYISGQPKTFAMETGIKNGMKKLKETVLNNAKSQIAKELENIE